MKYTFNRYGELDSQIHLFRPLAPSALLIQKQQNTYLDTAYLPWKFPLQIWLKKDIKDHTLLFINIPWSTLFAYSCWFLGKNRNKRTILQDSPLPNSQSYYRIHKFNSHLLHYSLTPRSYYMLHGFLPLILLLN